MIGSLRVKIEICEFLYREGGGGGGGGGNFFFFFFLAECSLIIVWYNMNKYSPVAVLGTLL